MARKNGSNTMADERTRCARDKAWQSMRIMRRFTVADLCATAEIGKDNAGVFVRGLVGVGYIRECQAKQNGRRGGHAVYQLIRNSGPKAPRLRTNGWVYDPNGGAVIQPKAEQTEGAS